MAILKSVVDVNNGNTGWTKADVMDALETVFANLGWHGGTQVSGVPARAQSPGGVVGIHDTWRQLGGSEPPTISYKNRYYDVINQSDTSYRILEKYFADSVYSFRSDTDNITISQHGLNTGDAIHWAPGGTIETQNVGGLTLDTIYYVIKVDDNTIRLAANATDATNGAQINLLDGGWAGGGYAAKSGTVYGFRDVNDAAYDNAEITCNISDILNFNITDTTSGGGFYICRNTSTYSSNTEVRTDNWGGNANRVSATGLGTNTVTWDTVDWGQSNNVPFPTDHVTQNPETNGVTSYIYVNSAIPSMKATINVLPVASSRGSTLPFWIYTVPANGGRSELKLQVYRYSPNYGSSYRNRISGVFIFSQGSGWIDNETFTIPGDQIGGTSPANDLVFGIQTSGSSTDGDGIATIQVTNLGAGSNFFQKHPNGSFAILKNVNDNSKKFGTTYYSFSPDSANDYRMYINSGSGWRWMNVYGEGYSVNDNSTNYGFFTGVSGLDNQQSYNYPARNDSSFTHFNYASTATPTAYPLSIRTYRAQAPQDQNFAVIQFTQTINGAIIPYGTFTIHKGATFGSNVWDLEHLYLGTYTQFDVGSRDIFTYYRSPGNYIASSVYPTKEPINVYSKTREASYGYLRDEYGDLHRTRYTCNIDTDVDNNNTQHISIYYRNSTYDGSGIAPEANYYKPIKGLPIDNGLVPCPYYMPDDFAMLQVSTTPGLTQFRPGDTITISPSEVYEVILAGYQTQQNGLDNINNNSTIGMIFMARTT